MHLVQRAFIHDKAARLDSPLEVTWLFSRSCPNCRPPACYHRHKWKKDGAELLCHPPLVSLIYGPLLFRWLGLSGCSQPTLRDSNLNVHQWLLPAVFVQRQDDPPAIAIAFSAAAEAGDKADH